jgi:hypothetical protein
LQAELLEIVCPLRFLSNVLSRSHRLVPNKLHNKSVSKVFDGTSQANPLEHAAQFVSASLPNNRCRVHRQGLNAGRKRNTRTDSIGPGHVSEAFTCPFLSGGVCDEIGCNGESNQRKLAQCGWSSVLRANASGHDQVTLARKPRRRWSATRRGSCQNSFAMASCALGGNRRAERLQSYLRGS